MEYTKGQWRPIKDAQGICMIMHPDKEGLALAVFGDTFKPSKGFWYDEIWLNGGIAEREANAQLIAAAPAMYEALKLAITVLVKHNIDDSCTEALSAIYAVLNKAEGKGE